MNIKTSPLSDYSKTLYSQFKQIPIINKHKLEFIKTINNNRFSSKIKYRTHRVFKEAQTHIDLMIKNKQLSFKPNYYILDNTFTQNSQTPLGYKKTPIPKYLKGRFAAKTVIEIINNECIYCVSMNFTICGVNSNINFFTTTKWTPQITTKIKRIIKRIFFIIFFFREHTCNTPDELSLDLFLINSNKKIPRTRNNNIDVDHINSGFTRFDKDGSKCIIIYRDEEMDKLILHELIHFFRLDFETLYYNLSEIINVKSSLEFIPNEAYTELITIILHSNLMSLEIYNNTKYSSRILNIEIIFGLFQCAKLLFHYNYPDIDTFFIPYSQTTNHPDFYQNSCIISYFFIKISLLINLDQTTQFLDSYMHNYKINSSTESKKQFIELIKTSISNSVYQQHIQYFLEFISTRMRDSNAIDYINTRCSYTKKHTLMNSSCKKHISKTMKHSISKFGNTSIFKTNRMSLIELR